MVRTISQSLQSFRFLKSSDLESPDGAPIGEPILTGYARLQSAPLEQYAAERWPTHLEYSETYHFVCFCSIAVADAISERGKVRGNFLEAHKQKPSSEGCSGN